MANGSFVPSINVDSCIIEEQDDHLVLAIRVPKATIANNYRSLLRWLNVAGIKKSGAPDPPRH